MSPKKKSRVSASPPSSASPAQESPADAGNPFPGRSQRWALALVFALYVSWLLFLLLVALGVIR
ncbi:MAG: hypothetical protein ACK49R_01275 [Planctomycetota bacterium]|jgi:hypothetical protein